VPHRTYAQLLLPLLRLGRPEEAREYHQTGYRLIGEDPEFLAAAARHLEYLAITGELDEALQVAQTHLPNAVSTPSVGNRMRFYGAVWIVLIMLFDDGQRKLRLKLPASFPLFDPQGMYETAVLRDWFGKEVKVLVVQFDHRNGNSHYMRWFARRWRLPPRSKTRSASQR
jgi:hypothetical protein